MGNRLARSTGRAISSVKRGISSLLKGLPVFYVYLDGKIVRDLPDQGQTSRITRAVFSRGSSERVVNIKHLRKTFNRLAALGELQAVVLELGPSLSGSLIDRLELTQMIKTLRENTNATVYALSEVGYESHDYLIASAADQVVVGDDSAGVGVVGESGGGPYIGPLLKNLGVDFYHASTGDHKTALETFRLAEMSDGERENQRAINSERWDVWKQVVESNRPDRINLDAYPSLAEDSSESTVLDTFASRYFDAFELAGGDAPALALATGLADMLSSQLWKQIAATLEISYDEFVRDRSSKVANYDDFFSGLPPIKTLFKASSRKKTGEVVEETTQAKLGRLRLSGLIRTPNARSPISGGITLASVRRKLAKLAKKDIDAIVVEIDSPGGEAIASELVRKEIQDFSRARQLPVYIWMGNVAASGGYWIATLGEKIYAHPATITGSIGVVAGVPNFGNIAERFGINVSHESTHPRNDIFSGGSILLKPVNPRFQQFLETTIANAYSRFTRLVSDTRDIPLQRVEELAGGRVYGALAAREHGLIDEVADLEATYTQIAKEIGKTGYSIVEVKVKETKPRIAAFLSSSLEQQDATK